MRAFDAIIVGGGPAGSSCAAALVRAGGEVAVVDRARFPRDKVCAGWITPQVVTALDLDLEAYGRTLTLQPIGGFRTGVIGSSHVVDTSYSSPVSYGIRRCEFDNLLLARSGAQLFTGEGAASIRRSGGRWIVNDRLTAPVIVGAGGHFCPVARLLNAEARRPSNATLVVAQEAEFPAGEASGFAVDPERPELYFCRDLKGYGWLFRKGAHINIGLGRLDRESLPAATRGFVSFLEQLARVPRGCRLQWRGHAYFVNAAPRRRVVGDEALLVGDAAGLAYAQSGEGIRPAVESGLLAAAALIAARGDYRAPSLDAYEQSLSARLPPGGTLDRRVRLLPEAAAASIAASIGRLLLAMPPFVRHIALDRWFLHREQGSLQLAI
jgi:flavin-dependent dehydrogenase